jgi:hypothetical protein
MKNSKVSIETFRKHLLTLLPMRAPSYKRGTDVEEYIASQLTKIGRVPYFDKHGNILDIVGDRAIVAHTDAVDQKGGKRYEPVIVQNGIIRSRRGLRPIGGDDKVGIAVALTIAAVYPEISVCMFADEEVGCRGSYSVKLPKVLDLAVQCDRNGCNDVVYDTVCGPIASLEAECEIENILPHRVATVGSITDVIELVQSAQCNNAINLSCGYYQPHSRKEYIVLAHAIQALLDAENVLCNFPNNVEVCHDRDNSTNWADYHEPYENVVKPTVRALTNWDDWELIEQCKNGPFSDDAADWFETCDGGYAHIATGETVPAVAVQRYYAFLADNVSNPPFYREESVPAEKSKLRNKGTLARLRQKGA